MADMAIMYIDEKEFRVAADLVKDIFEEYPGNFMTFDILYVFGDCFMDPVAPMPPTDTDLTFLRDLEKLSTTTNLHRIQAATNNERESFVEAQGTQTKVKDVLEYLMRIVHFNAASVDGKLTMGDVLPAKPDQMPLKAISGAINIILPGREAPKDLPMDVVLRRAFAKKGVGSCDACKRNPATSTNGDENGAGDHESLDKPLKYCSKCRVACYCSAECQKAAWNSGHKNFCRVPFDFRAGDVIKLKMVDSVTLPGQNGIVIDFKAGDRLSLPGGGSAKFKDVDGFVMEVKGTVDKNMKAKMRVPATESDIKTIKSIEKHPETSKLNQICAAFLVALILNEKGDKQGQVERYRKMIVYESKMTYKEVFMEMMMWADVEEVLEAYMKPTRHNLALLEGKPSDPNYKPYELVTGKTDIRVPVLPGCNLPLDLPLYVVDRRAKEVKGDYCDHCKMNERWRKVEAMCEMSTGLTVMFSYLPVT
ncbi:hypothetical protein HDU76_012682 [Blyttiomyces sp. JEL0837]|nr:hypothetical protein HDU76_012682 [Blyttiomyces sp. JEL0837]